MYSARYFCQILSKRGVSRQLSLKVCNIKVHGATLIHADRRTVTICKAQSASSILIWSERLRCNSVMILKTKINLNCKD